MNFYEKKNHIYANPHPNTNDAMRDTFNK